MVYGYQSFVENFCRLKTLGSPHTCVSIYRSSRSHSTEVYNTDITPLLPPKIYVYVCLYKLRQCECLTNSTRLVLEGSSDYANTLHTHPLTPWCRVLDKLNGLQLVKKFPAFHRIRKFITALATVRHLSLSWASPLQSIYPHPNSWRSILILSTHLSIGLPIGLFPSGFPHQDPTHNPLLTHMRHMPSPSHSSRFYHPHNIG